MASSLITQVSREDAQRNQGTRNSLTIFLFMLYIVKPALLICTLLLPFFDFIVLMSLHALRFALCFTVA